MAYEISLPSSDRDYLDCRLEGGDPKNPKMDLMHPEGFLARGSTISGCFSSSIPVPPEFMASLPKRIIIKPYRGFIPDFSFGGDFNGWVVTDQMVEIVERLESNVHQFFEIPEAITTKGELIPKKFFLMNVLTRLAAIDIERSRVEWHVRNYEVHGKKVESRTLVEKAGPMKDDLLILSKNAIGHHHLWRGNKQGLMGQHFCSNAVYEEMVQAGLSALRIRKLEES